MGPRIVGRRKHGVFSGPCITHHRRKLPTVENVINRRALLFAQFRADRIFEISIQSSDSAITIARQDTDPQTLAMNEGASGGRSRRLQIWT